MYLPDAYASQRYSKQKTRVKRIKLHITALHCISYDVFKAAALIRFHLKLGKKTADGIGSWDADTNADGDKDTGVERVAGRRRFVLLSADP